MFDAVKIVHKHVGRSNTKFYSNIEVCVTYGKLTIPCWSYENTFIMCEFAVDLRLLNVLLPVQEHDWLKLWQFQSWSDNDANTTKAMILCNQKFLLCQSERSKTEV